MTFTTGLNSRNRPTDNIEEISVTQEKVYLYTRWTELGDAPHKYACEIFNSYGQLVFRDEREFRSKTGSYRTWTRRRLIEGRDKSGDWRFVVYLDNRRVAEKTLIVLDADGKRYDPERVRALLDNAPSLENALSTYRTLESYRELAQLTTSRSAPSREQSNTEKILFEMKRPGQFLLRYYEGPAERMLIASDGSNIITYSSEPHEVYHAHEVPKDLAGTSIALPTEMTVPRIIYSLDSARDLLEFADSVSESPLDERGEPTLIKVEIRYSPPLKPPIEYHLGDQSKATLSLWIDQKEHLIRKSSLDVHLDQERPVSRYGQGPPYNRVLVTQVTHPEINPEFDDKHFVLVPPDTAKSLDERRAEHESPYPVMVGKNVPDFTLKDTKGQEVSSDDFREKVILIELWGSWSVLCRERFPLLKSLKSTYGNQGFEILGISVRDSTIGAKQMAQAYKLNYPILIADENTEQEFGGIPGLPTSILVDRKGVVRYKNDTLNLISLQKQVEDLMAEGSTSEADNLEADLAPNTQMFVGRWENEDPEIGIMTTVEIRFREGGLEVQAWGACQPKDCDWGVRKPIFVDSRNGVLSLGWPFSGFTHRQLITLSTRDRIQILGHTINKEGRPGGEYTCVFRRAESEKAD
jgi:peroxiredoxin/outer membrane lipoprotein-sorting protein